MAKVNRLCKIALVLMIAVLSTSINAKGMEIGFLYLEQNESVRKDFTIDWELKYRKSLNKLHYGHHSVTDMRTREELVLDSWILFQHINIIGKYEYFDELMTRHRIGAGIGKKWGMFAVKQYFMREALKDGEDKNLLDTGFEIDMLKDRDLGIYYAYSFVTNFADTNFKYLDFKLMLRMSAEWSIAWELKRRWEEKRSDLNRLLVTLKI